MEFLILLIVILFLFGPVAVIGLLARTSRHAERLQSCEEELSRLRQDFSAREEELARLRKALRDAGFSPADDDAKPAARPETLSAAFYAPAAAEPYSAEPELPVESPAGFLPPEIWPPAKNPETPAAQTPPLAETLPENPKADSQNAAPPTGNESSPAESGAPSLIDTFTRFIKGGNLWVAGGVVLLFTAFGLLLTYIARRGFFTIEMRIAAAIVSGFAMLVFGWKFRGRKPVYALVIQGGGIGVLYLSFVAAAKLTELLPAPAALALITLLIPSTIALALLQDSQALAVFGLLGGFAAPILLSSNSGNYIALFSYYTILDLAVLVISRRRLWRVLNMSAAVLTFAVALAWIGDRYEPEMFAAAEPFMLGFILIFTFLGIQSARRTKISLQNYVDIPLTIGTPFLGALTQWQIFEYIDHGLAIVCIAFSAFYLFLTWLIWKKSGVSLRALAEGYLGLSVLLANLAVPLELSHRVTSAVWAAEGVLIFAFGCRLKSARLLAASIIFHIASAVMFFAEIDGGVYYKNFPAFRSSVFAGGIIIALTACLTAVLAARRAAADKDSGTATQFFTLSAVFSVWGLLWWLASWRAEFHRLPGYSFAEFFLCASFTALAAWGAARRFRCPALLAGIVPPVILALYIIARTLRHQIGYYSDVHPLDILTINFFEGMFLWGWLVFFASQAFLLWHARELLIQASWDTASRPAGERIPLQAVHAVWLALLLFIAVTVFTCTGRAFTAIWGLSRSWKSFAGVLPAFVCVALISRLARRFASTAYRTALLIWLPRILCTAVGIWFTGTLFALGDPAPLPLYIPVLNPLELQQAFCIILIIYRQVSLARAGARQAWKPQTLFVIADIMVFFWLTAMTARSARWFLGLPLSEALASGQFHLALLVLWGIYGISHILAGHKKSFRGLWLAGATLTVVDIAKLLLIDLANTGTITRIISFFVAGLLLLFIGWAAPLPPARENFPDRSEK